MDFSPGPTQLAVRETVRKLAQQEVCPVVIEGDRVPRPEDAYPWDLVRKASGLGLRTPAWRAGWAVEHDPHYDATPSFMTKVFACEMAVEVTLRATEVLGRFGTWVGVPIEKYHPDALTVLTSAGGQQVLPVKTADAVAGKPLRDWAARERLSTKGPLGPGPGG